MSNADQRLQVLVKPMANVTGEYAPCAVLRAKTSDGRNIGPSESILGIGKRFAQKRQPQPSTITHCGLSDDERYGEKAVLLFEKSADIEPAVIRDRKSV